MSATTEPNPGRSTHAWSAVWRPGALVYLAMLLGGLAAGLWPQYIYPAQRNHPVPLPALQCLIAAQAAFFILVFPLFLRRSASPGAGDASGAVTAIAGPHGPGCWCRYLAAAAAQTIVLVVIAAPFYVLAAYLADATATDVLRAVVYIVSICPLAWWGGWALARSGGAVTAALLVLLTAGLGLPAAWYIARDFFNSSAAATLWRIAPALEAWNAAASRSEGLLPVPAWPVIVFPIVACVLALVCRLFRGRA